MGKSKAMLCYPCNPCSLEHTAFAVMNRNPSYLVQWSIGESCFCNVISKTPKAALCTVSRAMYSPGNLGRTFLASRIASLLQWEKLSQGGNKTGSRLHSKYFPTLLFVQCCIRVLRHPSYKLRSRCVGPCGLAQDIFRGGALVFPNSPCSV